MKVFGLFGSVIVLVKLSLIKNLRWVHYLFFGFILILFFTIVLFFSISRPIAIDLDIITEAVEFELLDQLNLSLEEVYINTANIPGSTSNKPDDCEYLGRDYIDFSGDGTWGVAKETDFEASNANAIEVVVPAGTRLRASSQSSGLLRLEILKTVPTQTPSFNLVSNNPSATTVFCLPQNSDIETTVADAAEGGLLVLEAESVRFGRSNHNANRLHGALKSGEFRILEDLVFVSGLTEVRKDNIALGESVQIASARNDGAPVPLQMLFDFNGRENTDAAIRVHARSSLGYYQIEINRGDSFSTRVIRSKWYDRALYDPAVLGATAILVLLLLFLEIWLAVRSLAVKDNSDKPK